MHDSERELALHLTPARGQHTHAHLADQPAGLGQQPGLADAGGALDEQHLCPSGGDGVDRRLQRGELALAL
jgi:hypothetical protein